MLARALNKSAQQPSLPEISGPWTSNSSRHPPFSAALPISIGNRLVVDKSAAESSGSEAFSFSEDDLHFNHNGSPPSASDRVALAQTCVTTQIASPEDTCNQDIDHDLFLLEEEADEVTANAIPLRASSSRARHQPEPSSSSLGIPSRKQPVLQSCCLSAEGLGGSEEKQQLFTERLSAFAVGSPLGRSVSARPMQIASSLSMRAQPAMRSTSMQIRGASLNRHQPSGQTEGRFVPPHEMSASVNAELHGFASLNVASSSMRHKSVADKLVAIMHEQGLPTSSQPS